MGSQISDSNTFLKNAGLHPMVGYNFMLRVEGIFDLPCKAVKAISKELEFDYVQEGGLNDYVHMLRKPISKPFTLRVERYVGLDYLDPMPLGAELVLPVLLFVSRVPISSAGDVFGSDRIFAFTGCTVIAKDYGDLAAEQSSLIVETTTLAYREMVCLNIPIFDNDPRAGAPENHPTNYVGQESIEEYKRRSRNLLAKATDANAKGASAYTEAVQLADKFADAIGTLETEINVRKTALAALEGETAGKETALTTAETTLKTKKDALDKAREELEKAKRALHDAQRAVREEQARQDNEQEDASQEPLKQADDETREDTQTVPEDVQKNLEAAQTALETAQKSYDKALGEWTSADQTRKAARDALAEHKAVINSSRRALATENQKLAALSAANETKTERLKEIEDSSTAMGSAFSDCGKENTSVQTGADIKTVKEHFLKVQDATNTTVTKSSTICNTRDYFKNCLPKNSQSTTGTTNEPTTGTANEPTTGTANETGS
ncbi:MAG: hypothetical protein ACOX66_06295 [Oscillospiraceae bacterium]|jgi:hypothetical protein